MPFRELRKMIKLRIDSVGSILKSFIAFPVQQQPSDAKTTILSALDDGRESMCNNNHGLANHGFLKSLPDKQFGFSVKR